MDKIILVVEPDGKTANKLSKVFGKERLAAKVVARVSEAIRSIQEEHVSVLILDVGVKDMAWHEVVPIVKGLDPRLPIILTSSHNTPELEAAIIRHKVFYYHVKSFGNEELILAVRNAVERAQTPGKKPPSQEEGL